MALADAQARWMIPLVLQMTLDKVNENERIVERFKDGIGVLHRGISFTDNATGQIIHAVAYVLISENADEVTAAANVLASGIQTDL